MPCCYLLQAAEAEAHRQKMAEQERQAELIRQERQRLLREAAYLKDYLPKGVLLDLEDLQIINDAAAGQLPDQTLVGSSGLQSSAQQNLHPVGPVHGVHADNAGTMSELLHYANYVPGRTAPLQGTTHFHGRH